LTLYFYAISNVLDTKLTIASSASAPSVMCWYFKRRHASNTAISNQSVGNIGGGTNFMAVGTPEAYNPAQTSRTGRDYVKLFNSVGISAHVWRLMFSKNREPWIFFYFFRKSGKNI
jgi:hypothetical protein